MELTFKNTVAARFLADNRDLSFLPTKDDIENDDSAGTLVAGVQINCLASLKRCGNDVSYRFQKFKHDDVDRSCRSLYLLISIR